jgi:hypothetical protein
MWFPDATVGNSNDTLKRSAEWFAKYMPDSRYSLNPPCLNRSGRIEQDLTQMRGHRHNYVSAIRLTGMGREV